MALTTTQLEKKIWYRAIKVLYIAGWLLIIGLVILAFYANKPYTYLDRGKSSVLCTFKGDSYQLSNLDADTVSTNNNDKAYKFCKDIAQYQEKLGTDGFLYAGNSLIYSKDKQWVFNPTINDFVPNAPENRQTILQNAVEDKNTPVYKLNHVYSTNGSWGDAMKWSGGTFLIGAVFLETIKKAFLYVFLGKKIL